MDEKIRKIVPEDLEPEDHEAQKEQDEQSLTKIKIWHEEKTQIDIEGGTKAEWGVVHFEIEGLHGIVPVMPEGYEIVKSDLEFKKNCEALFLQKVREAGAMAVAQTIIERARRDENVQVGERLSKPVRKRRGKNRK